MSQNQAGTQSDPLILNKLYSEPKLAFLHQPKSLEEIKSSCLIFLDTNVLLIPYNTSPKSLAWVKELYSELAKDNRLLLPDRVMQEFETNVPEQLKRVFQTISLAQNVNIPSIQLPLLEEEDEYKSLKKIEGELNGSIATYRKAVRQTLSVIEKWNHNDPVRRMYREIFKTAPAASITSLNEIDLLKQWTIRLNNKIPPGYKDGGKEDSGIGDYLVWQAVLDTCAKLKRDAIFVSGEQKPDWWHTVSGKSLYPRRELVEEFRRVTGGHSIHLLKPDSFFELFGASSAVVTEIKQEQVQLANSQSHRRSGVSLTKIRINSLVRWIEIHLGDLIFTQSYSENSGELVTGMHGDTERNSFFIIPVTKDFDSDSVIPSTVDQILMEPLNPERDKYGIYITRPNESIDHSKIFDSALINDFMGYAIGHFDVDGSFVPDYENFKAHLSRQLPLVDDGTDSN